MEITLQSIHFTADQKLTDYIHEKIDRRSHLLGDATEVQVFLKLDGVNGNGVHEKVAEIKVILPGHILFAKDQTTTFETAVDVALENVLTQVQKYRDKVRG